MEDSNAPITELENGITPEQPIQKMEADDSEHPMETEDLQNVPVDAEQANLTMFEPEEEMDKQMEEDDKYGYFKSEATFDFTVENIHKMNESMTSSSTYVRGIPWKILVMPRLNADRAQHTKNLGYFLQCNAENDSNAWSCHGSAQLRILPAKESGKMLEKKIDHLFHCKENDWGFSNFIPWNDLVSPDKGYMTETKSVTFQVHVFAEAPHGVAWDSRKLTGYIGLKNQGATCYMNSVLQTLYFTSKLRKAVYLMPTENDDAMKSVSLALQRVFCELQTSDKPVGTKKLTKSFGWETLDSFMQHDVQEFFRVLIDNLESKMKGTCVEGTMPMLFEGRTVTYVKCKSVDYVSNREEVFYDIQLRVKGYKNVYESFKQYIKPEVLDGENKYDAGDFGLQEAEKGILFKSFPPVLHLQLLRYQYDPVSDLNIKINDRYEFPERLQLDDFLQSPDPSDPATYILHAVLVHSGDNHGGHYVAYLNPQGDGRWCKFDDDVVSRCSKKEAFNGSYGGRDDDNFIMGKHSTNAYMLSYIRESKLAEILCKVEDFDVPEHLRDRINEERRLDAYRRRERNEQYLYMGVNIVTEDQFFGHQGEDLFDAERPTMMKMFRAMKNQTFSEFLSMLAESFGYDRKHVRVWPLNLRQNQTLRPSTLDDADAGAKPLSTVADNENPWNIWLELHQPDSPSNELLPFHKDDDVLLFMKYYDPTTKTLNYCGYVLVPFARTKIGDLEPKLRERAALPPDTPLLLFEEVQPQICTAIPNKNVFLGEAMDKIMDGNIIIFQIDSPMKENYQLPTAKAYFRDLFYRVNVLFVNKNDPTDNGTLVTLNQKMSYNEVAKEVAKCLNTDHMMLQFFRVQAVRDMAGNVIKSNFEGQLKDLLQMYGTRKQTRKLYYQELTMKVDELETKRHFRCVYVDPTLKEEEINLYVNKNSTVSKLLEECRKKFNIPSSQELRMLDVTGNKIVSVIKPDSWIDSLALHSATARIFRIEQVPADQSQLADDELLINVVHFHKEIINMFGTTFLIKIKSGQKMSEVKANIQKMLGVGEKDFNQWQVAVIQQGQKVYIDKAVNIPNVKEMMSSAQTNLGTPIVCSRAWIGLDHLNKAPKRRENKFNPERSIKIHN